MPPTLQIDTSRESAYDLDFVLEVDFHRENLLWGGNFPEGEFSR